MLSCRQREVTLTLYLAVKLLTIYIRMYIVACVYNIDILEIIEEI